MDPCNILLNQAAISEFFDLSATIPKIQFLKLDLTYICIYDFILNSRVYLREVISFKLLSFFVSMSFMPWQRKLETQKYLAVW